MSDPRYPIGKYEPQLFSKEQKEKWLADIRFLPEELERSILNLDAAQLETPYREGGWTVRQLVHHVADSHMNAFLRLRLALTEDWPTIKPYDEKAWAMLRDSTGAPVGWSLDLLESLHARWVLLLDSLTDEQWTRGVKHPENGPMTIEVATLVYAWHSKHHVAHMTRLREQKGW